MSTSQYAVRIPFGIDEMVFDYCKVAFGKDYFSLTVDEQRVAIGRVQELRGSPYEWMRRASMRTLEDYSLSELRSELLKRQAKVDAEPYVIARLREYNGPLTEPGEYPTYGVDASEILEEYDTLAEAYTRLLNGATPTTEAP